VGNIMDRLHFIGRLAAAGSAPALAFVGARL
jgi:hypothetical protein